jgi:redox-sensitive bicupin YhaK (pirin superfamily)
VTDGRSEPIDVAPETGHSGIEVTRGRVAEVGGLAVSRTLPRRERRTIGPWCFVDHFGPTDATMRVGPHPHTGLHTVTWLLEGEVLHTDSLGSRQAIRPGQLNLMTAGEGIAHAEDAGAEPRRAHGVQLWVAQPDSTRHGPPRFAHFPHLPVVALGAATVTVLTGALAGAASPAATDWPSVAADVVVDGSAEVPLDPAHEHGIVALQGTVEVDGRPVAVGSLAHLGTGREAVELRSTAAPARLMVIGGAPFEEQLVMWWNFVGRDRSEVERFAEEWNAGSDRFGRVSSSLDVIPAPRPPWLG